MEQANLFYRFGVALAIGFLVGLQREYAHAGSEKEIFAGERTMALMGILGALAAMIADELASPWPFVGIVLPVAALIAIAYAIDAWHGRTGLTTEVAALVTVVAGALCYWSYLALAVAIAVATTALLSFKIELDSFVRRIEREDVYATLKFAVITAIVLPVLPDQAFGPPPFDVLNPYRIWLMVVLISGISFLGYLLIKLVGPSQGIGLTGLLGGLVSSTGVTLSFAQRSGTQRELAKPFALGIMVAWTVMFARVVSEVAVLNRPLVGILWIPMTAAAVAGLAYCLYLYLSQRTDQREEVSFSNPFELGPAVKFGLIYAVILLVSRSAQIYLGNTGVYLSSIVAGLADVDAITLSVAQLSQDPGVLSLGTAARAIVLATLANTAVKGGVVLTSGSRTLRRALWPGLLAMLVVGISGAWLLA